MVEELKFNDIYQSKLLQQTLFRLFGREPIEVIHRSASYILKQISESKEKIKRVLLLPPGGYTANSLSETNSHPEARFAKITIKGGIDPQKVGFSLVRNAIKFAYFTSRDFQTEGVEPYVRINPAHPLYREKLKSAKETFFVVREDGEGFYHNLINVSPYWMLMILEKFLTQRRDMNFGEKINILSAAEQESFRYLVMAIFEKGDRIFQENMELVNKVAGFPADRVLPALVEGLNFLETGKHEPCSIYAMILKVGRKDPKRTLDYLTSARAAEEAPLYYLDELICKFQYDHAPR